MNHNNVIKVIGIVVIAAILLGEVIVYTSGSDNYDINASLSENSVNYSISVSGSQPYNMILMESGMQPMDEIYVYYDKSYATAYNSEEGPTGSIPTDQNYYLDQLMKNLDYRGGPPVKMMNASELAEAMTNDTASGGLIDKGLVVISGALPDTIYSGNAGDLILQWINGGGRLYWAGNLLGKYTSSASGCTPAGDDYQELFFGADCLNTSDSNFVSHIVESNDLGSVLSLKNNRIKFGIDVSELPSSTKYLAIGYSEDAYASIVFAECGNGMICVLGGDLSGNQWSDMSQIISAGICYSTNVVGTADGSIKYSEMNGTFDITGISGDITLYAYLGGYFPIYGRLFLLQTE